MGTRGDFDFGAGSVAEAYESDLVPVLFEPWAISLLGRYPHWHGRRVLDLGAGTGIVTRLLAQRVGSTGHVIAADVSAEMLSQARLHCAALEQSIDFVESGADAIGIPESSVDVVVCQQSFQFFPDKPAAAREIHRVLRKEGRVMLSTWRPVSECEYFGVLCEVLTAIGEEEISDSMRLPFDFMPESELSACFTSAGFSDVAVSVEHLPLVLPGGLPQAIQLAYATPIGPKLQALSDDKQRRFRDTMAERVGELSQDGTDMGPMTANVLSAVKPS